MLKSPFLVNCAPAFSNHRKVCGRKIKAISSMFLIFWRSHYRNFARFSIVPKTTKLWNAIFCHLLVDKKLKSVDVLFNPCLSKVKKSVSIHPLHPWHSYRNRKQCLMYNGSAQKMALRTYGHALSYCSAGTDVAPSSCRYNWLPHCGSNIASWMFRWNCHTAWQ